MAKVVEELQVLIKQHGAKEVTRAMKGMEKQTDKNVRGLLKMAAAYVSIRAVWTGAKGLGGLFAAQELAEKRLESTTRRLGDTSGRLADLLKEQAAALQLVSVHGDETIMKTQALLLNMGATEENIKQATQAAMDMASALGKDLLSATQQLGKTFGGFGGELSELIPELKELTSEELRQGKAVDLLLKKYGGAAKDDTRTLFGAMSQAGNAISDLGEKAFAPLAPLIRDAATAMSEMATQMNKAGESAEFLALVLGSVPGGGLLSDQLEKIAEAQRQLAEIRAAAKRKFISEEDAAAEADRLIEEALGIGPVIAPPKVVPPTDAERAARAKARAKAAGFEGFGFGASNEVEAIAAEAAFLAKRQQLWEESAAERVIIEADAARERAALDVWVADQAIEQQKRASEEAQRQWQTWAGSLSQNAVQASEAFGNFFGGVSAEGETAGEALKRALLSQIGDIAIAHGVVAMKTAFAEAYQSSGLSLVAVAPAALLIAAGVALKAGQVPPAAGGAGGGGGARGQRIGFFGGGAAAADQRTFSTTINITGFIGNDPMGAAREVSRIVTDAQREAG